MAKGEESNIPVSGMSDAHPMNVKSNQYPFMLNGNIMTDIYAGINLTNAKKGQAESESEKNIAQTKNTIPLEAAKTQTQINQINQNQNRSLSLHRLN
mgnify:CR=1 FL=1